MSQGEALWTWVCDAGCLHLVTVKEKLLMTPVKEGRKDSLEAGTTTMGFCSRGVRLTLNTIRRSAKE